MKKIIQIIILLSTFFVFSISAYASEQTNIEIDYFPVNNVYSADAYKLYLYDGYNYYAIKTKDSQNREYYIIGSIDINSDGIYVKTNLRYRVRYHNASNDTWYFVSNITTSTYDFRISDYHFIDINIPIYEYKATDLTYGGSNGSRLVERLSSYLNGYNNTWFEDITPIPEEPEYDPNTAEYEPDDFENLKYHMSQWKKTHDEMETLLEFTGPLKDYVKGEGKLKGVEYVLRPHNDLLDTEHIFVPIEEYEAFLEHGGTEDKWSIKFNSNPLNNQLTYAIPYDDTIFNEPIEIETEEPIESYDIMVRPVSYNEDTRTYTYGNYTTVKNITNNTIGTETQQNYQETNEYITNLNTTEYQITNNEGDVINNYYEYTYTTINNTDNPNREPLFRFPDIQLPDVDIDPDLDIGDIFEGVDLVGLGAFLTGFLAVFLIFFNLFIGLCNWMPLWARVIFVIGVIVAFVVLIVRMFIERASE